MPRIILLLCLAATLTACTQTKPPATNEPPKTIKVRSTAFEDGQPIPKTFTEDGQDVSPPLAWDGVPEGTKEMALICDDPDAPTAKPWVHWVIYKIPATVRELPEGLPTDARLGTPIKAMQGLNSWPDGRTVGYRGPAPPSGRVHHYHFKVYALDRELELVSKLDKAVLLKAMEGCILAWGEVVGTYER
jgi:Raf kinase inhibitor-like YbhB/YbcL family protein